MSCHFALIGSFNIIVDHSWVVSDNNNEKGCIVTLAWLKPVSAHINIAAGGWRADDPSRYLAGDAPRLERVGRRAGSKDLDRSVVQRARRYPP